MAIINMKKIFLLGMQTEMELILKALQSMGNVEIAEIEEIEGSADALELYGYPKGENDSDDVFAEIEAQISEVDFALSFISKYGEQKKGLFAVKPELEIEKFNEALGKRHEILKVAQRCRALADKAGELRTQETRQLNIMAQMKPWEALDVPFEDIHDTVSVRVMAGTVDKNLAGHFEEAISSDSTLPVHFQRLGEDREDAYYLILYHKKFDEDISQILKEFAFSKSNFSGFRGTPSSVVKDCEKILRSIKEEHENIEKEAASLVSYRRELEILYDALSIERERSLAAQKLMRTSHTFVLKGWIPAESVETFSKNLSNITSNYYVSFEDPEPEEEFPVALRNNAFVEPFEVVTNLYSIPNSRELDPNAYMAPFFATLFGIMLGDAGYGLILAIVAYFAIRKMKLYGDTGKLVRLMIWTGISTVIWGALLGSWFGDIGTRLGIPTILFNPMDEPIGMLLLCFGIGVIHLFAGMAINAYKSIRSGHILDAIFDQGLWFIFYLGLITLGIGAVAGLNGLFQVGKVLSIVGAVGLVLTQGRDKKNIIAKFLSGVLSLYNVSGFLSDVLSYSRLFALGLTTGVIGMVVNQLGGMLGTSWIGWVFAAIIFAFGHIFNIAINVLGSFVHSSRLQYIEFYGKFYEGGGKAFNPLTFATRYNDVKKLQ